MVVEDAYVPHEETLAILLERELDTVRGSDHTSGEPNR